MQLNKPLSEKKIRIETENAVFLNFDYTKTLEFLYEVKSESILHIYGCVDADEDFIIGHGKTLEDLRREIRKENWNHRRGLMTKNL